MDVAQQPNVFGVVPVYGHPVSPAPATGSPAPAWRRRLGEGLRTGSAAAGRAARVAARAAGRAALLALATASVLRRRRGLPEAT